jgi:flavin-dependent dehydrogenase
VRSVETLVIGGGPAGAAAAIELARAGREVLLVERHAGPFEKVCGCFLSPPAIGDLAALGVDVWALGAARIDRVGVLNGRNPVAAALPFTAASLSRRALDEALLRIATAVGAGLRRGRAVAALAGQPGDWRVRLSDDTAIDARDVFLATGKHELRGWARAAPRDGPIGLKCRWRLAPAEAASLAGRVELAAFPGGYAGLELLEDGTANLCLTIRPERFAALGRDWGGLLAWLRAQVPALGHRLAGAVPVEDRPLAIAAIPYGHVARSGDGLWRLGDQAAVIPSLVGEGMAIALRSGRLAAACHLAGTGEATYRRQIGRAVAMPMRLALLTGWIAASPAGGMLLRTAIGRLPGLTAAVARGSRLCLDQ